MARHHSFVPADPTGAALEGRLAPSSFGHFLDTNIKQIGKDLGLNHHHDKNAAAGIEQLWKDSGKLSHPAHQVAAHHAVKAK